MDGIGGDAGGGSGGSPSDAVMIMRTPDNSMIEDVPESRPKSLSSDQEPSQRDNPPIPFNTPVSLENTQRPPPQSPPPPSRQNMLPPLPPLSSPSSLPQNTLASSWSQTRSPTSAPSNPFYTSTYRSSTPPMPSSSEQSPIISPAKRFSSGEVKPVFTPNSPRQPLNEEDRIKFTQLATQLRTRLTYAAIKVENGWEKHSFSQIKSLLNEEQKPSQHHHHHQQRRRSHTIQDPPSNLTLPHGGGVGKQLTYESFWATHSQQRHQQQPSYTNPGLRSSQPFHHATFPRRKPERLSLQGIAQGHTARDQTAAEIMIALASPRTRSEFSSPERNTGGNVETDDEKSPTPSEGVRARKRIELDGDVDGVGIHA